ncbi:MAG: GHMP kinase [Planctomycetes bacterium]|nr:GHMP kinase [Planctomycetota bacterium]
MIIRAKSYPRAGLIGNPSDGYFGKTISFSFSNFCAEVVLYESPELEILPCEKDQSCFTSVQALVQDVELHGYYGGIRLLKATVKRFFDYCRDNQIELNTRNFTIRYDSNIPHGVGLAGSSAIITACLRALTTFYGVTIPKPTQASLILSAEVDELHIAAGLQDRVIQVYQGLVYMDFDKTLMEKQGHGQYEPIDHTQLPPLYVAYQEDLSEVSSKFHNNIRERFELGDKKIIAAMKYWGQLAAKARRCLHHGKATEIAALLDANFDKRASIYRISQDNIQMVETARALGASAKFTGSGGAIVGTYRDQKMFNKLKKHLGKLGVKVIKPRLIGPSPSACCE